MTDAGLEARYRAYLAALNERRLDDLAEFVQDDLTYNGEPMTCRQYRDMIAGDIAAIPVWTTSCTPAADPPPDYGFTPCAITDGATPPWSPNLSGRLVEQATQQITRGVQHWSVPLTADQRAQLQTQGHLLVSYETPANEVQAFDVRLSGTR